MTKVLYVATSDTHLATFHKPYIHWLKGRGCQVDIAVEQRGNYIFDDVANTHNLAFPRSISLRQLFKTYKDLKSIINNGNYALIHCHTPIPSVLARLASISARKRGTKVLYTAHGFHFFRGSPLINWLMYYPVELVLSRFTDGIVTINREDYEHATQKLLCKNVYQIKGIGVDSKRFQSRDLSMRNELRTTFGYDTDDFILLYIAEFIPRKNHKFIIRALPQLQARIPKLKVLFAGTGFQLGPMLQLASELGVNEVIHFLGFRDDIQLLCAVSDLGISSSLQEGLPIGVLELMMTGVPVVATSERGHRELIDDGINGYMYQHGDTETFIDRITKLYNDTDLRESMAQNAYKKAQSFDIELSLQSMADIYMQYLDH
jgi:glycosyltransferase EpsD